MSISGPCAAFPCRTPLVAGALGYFLLLAPAGLAAQTTRASLTVSARVVAGEPARGGRSGAAALLAPGRIPTDSLRRIETEFAVVTVRPAAPREAPGLGRSPTRPAGTGVRVAEARSTLVSIEFLRN